MDRPPSGSYTLSLHDALPISFGFAVNLEKLLSTAGQPERFRFLWSHGVGEPGVLATKDRKSTRLNSSHQIISYAVFCLKKKRQLLRLLRQTEQEGGSSLRQPH